MANADYTGAVPLTFGSAIDERPTFSPDEREIGFVSDRGGERAVWLVGRDGGAPRRLAVADVLGGVSWSRDGRRLVGSLSTGNLPSLTTIARDSGQLQPFTGLSGAATWPAWSPRDDTIAYVETDPNSAAHIRLVDSNGTPMPFPGLARTPPFDHLAWSPDGRRLAGASFPGSLWIIDPSSPVPYRRILTLPTATHVRGLAWTRDGTSLTVGLVTRTGDIVLAEARR